MFSREEILESFIEDTEVHDEDFGQHLIQYLTDYKMLFYRGKSGFGVYSQQNHGGFNARPTATFSCRLEECSNQANKKKFKVYCSAECRDENNRRINRGHARIQTIKRRLKRQMLSRIKRICKEDGLPGVKKMSESQRHAFEDVESEIKKVLAGSSCDSIVIEFDKRGNIEISIDRGMSFVGSESGRNLGNVLSRIKSRFFKENA